MRVREVRWERSSWKRKDAPVALGEGDGWQMASLGDSGNQSIDFSDTEKLSLLGM